VVPSGRAEDALQDVQALVREYQMAVSSVTAQVLIASCGVLLVYLLHEYNVGC
jgi:hypothetical protein